MRPHVFLEMALALLYSQSLYVCDPLYVCCKSLSDDVPSPQKFTQGRFPSSLRLLFLSRLYR